MISNHTFIGVVRLNDEGQLVCFCYQEDVQAGRCSCREEFDCPEAKVEVSIISGTRPSESKESEARKVSKELSESLRSVGKGAEKIKQGLIQLEKSINRNSRFRV